MLVKRGKKEVTSLSSDFKSGWWSISLDVVRQAIRAFSWVSMVCVAGSVFELKGLPIGGVLSGHNSHQYVLDAESVGIMFVHILSHWQTQRCTSDPLVEVSSNEGQALSLA